MWGMNDDIMTKFEHSLKAKCIVMFKMELILSPLSVTDCCMLGFAAILDERSFNQKFLQ